MKKIIYLDIDDTLADTSKKVIEEFNVKSFSFHNKFLLIKNLHSIIKVWRNIKQNHQFWEDLPLKQDAQLIYEISRKITDEIHILTALPPLFFPRNKKHFHLAAEAKRNWVHKHFPNIPKENIHVCYAREKHLVIKGKPANYILVDDSRKNIKNWENAGGTGILVEFNSQKHLFKLNKIVKNT
jgi:5'(3')-deoxyribonucleotidase